MAESPSHRQTPPPGVRCFVGARVDAASARQLRARFLTHYPDLAAPPGAPRRRGARLVPLANLHVTLRFLGSVPEPELAGLAALVDDLQGTPLTVAALGFAGLPRSERAHAVVADLAAHEQLAAWKTRVEQDVGPEDRPFRPHVTLARFRSRGAVVGQVLASPLALRLEAPRLFRSDPVRGGVRYTPISGPSPPAG